MCITIVFEGITDGWMNELTNIQTKIFEYSNNIWSLEIVTNQISRVIVIFIKYSTYLFEYSFQNWTTKDEYYNMQYLG